MTDGRVVTLRRRPGRRSWLRQALAVFVPAAAVLVMALDQPAPFSWSVPAALAACAALTLRGYQPLVSVVACLPALAGGLGWPPTLLALYTVGQRSRDLKASMLWAALCGLTALTPLLVLHPPWPRVVLTAATAVLCGGGPTVLGSLFTTREQLRASLRDLQAAREATVKAREEVARAAERDRIGREIHDSVGHHATMIVVGAAALAATSADDDTREAANRLRLLAKTALSEMRAALGLLGNDSEVRLGIAALPQLVDRARETGMRVEMIGVDSLGDDIPLGVERTTYRLVQESLTNAAKHAEGADVEVLLERWSRELRVTVTNGPPPRDLLTLPTSHTGGGLAGLAERIGMMGGQLRARPTPKGGFSVQGRLPAPPLDHSYDPRAGSPYTRVQRRSEVPMVGDTKVAMDEATNDGTAVDGVRAH